MNHAKINILLFAKSTERDRTLHLCNVIDIIAFLSYIHVQDVENSTVVPTKSDSDVMFCLQSYQGLRIDRSPVDRINTQVLYRFALAQMEGTR